jgi:hypothetical protein
VRRRRGHRHFELLSSRRLGERRIGDCEHQEESNESDPCQFVRHTFTSGFCVISVCALDGVRLGAKARAGPKRIPLRQCVRSGRGAVTVYTLKSLNQFESETTDSGCLKSFCGGRVCGTAILTS